MTDTEFNAIRRTGLGGSDLGAVLGLNRWRTPYQVWLEKTGRGELFEGNLQTRFGTHAEAFVADEYQARTGHRVQRFTGTLRHTDAPLIGHVDRLVIPDGAKVASHRREIRTDLGLECKTAHALAASRGDEWGDAESDRVPASYLIQCQTYMALTGCAHWDLAVLFGNSDFRIYHLHRDHELEALLIDEASRWWRDHIIADEPPTPANELEARQRWAAHQPGKNLEADYDMVQLLRQLAETKADIKALETDEQAIRDRLVPRLKDADTITWMGHNLCTYRANKDSQRIDWQAAFMEAAKNMDPLIAKSMIANYTKTTPGARVLRLSKDLPATP